MLFFVWLISRYYYERWEVVLNQSLDKRRLALREAECKAEDLFRAIEEKGILCSGITEKQTNREIY